MMPKTRVLNSGLFTAASTPLSQQTVDMCVCVCIKALLRSAPTAQQQIVPVHNKYTSHLWLPEPLSECDLLTHRMLTFCRAVLGKWNLKKRAAWRFIAHWFAFFSQRDSLVPLIQHNNNVRSIRLQRDYLLAKEYLGENIHLLFLQWKSVALLSAIVFMRVWPMERIDKTI